MANKEEDLKSRHIVTPVSISAKEYSSDNASGDENEINLGKSGADTEIRENVEMQSDQPISAEKNNMEIEQDLPQDENENKGIMASFRSLEGQKQKVGCLLLIAMVAIFAVIALIIVIQISNNRSTKTNVNVTPANAEVSEKQQADEAKVENLPNNQEIVSTQAEEQNTAVQQSTGTETGLKIMFGVFAFAAFLVLIFGGFMFFTSKDPLGKDKAKRIMIPASSALAILLVINGILFAYYSKKVPVQTYVDSPIAITYYSKSQTAAPLDVELDVSKLPEITNTRFISWNFGDGSKGSGAKVRHIFSKIGDFEATATFTLNDGTTKAYVRHVPVTNILPKIDVRVSKSTGLAPLTVSFDASGSTDENGTIVDYQWIFPNDVTKTGPLADFIFEQKGEYDVMLRVTDNNADTVESSTKISVVDEGAPMAVVDTIPSPPQGQIPLMVKFAAGRSYDPNGNIVRYEWNFGDGSERENGQNANHVFDKEGTYVVRLTVWDNSGMEKASQAEVKVLKKAIKPIGVISLDKGQFNGIVPLTLGLNAGYSRDEDGSIVSYQWDFGDGSTSATGQKAEHTYSKIGQYELSMTITDNDGLSTTKKQIIKVRAPEPTPPIVLLSTNPDPAAINVGDEMTFNASRSYDLDGHIISYEWNFGDKVVRLGSAEITHKYDHTGIYKVQVTAYDNSGKTSRAEVQVAVSEPNLIAKIEADQTSGLVPLVVQFGVTGNANTAVSYEWDFGDGLKSSTRSPLHIFTKAGEYSVRLKAADSAGIVSEDVMLIEVKERD